MNLARIFSPILVLFIIFSACERQTKPLGGEAEVEGQPAYTQVASVSEISHPANIEEVAPKVSTGPDGQKLFVANCAACHQTSGLGVPGAFPPLDDSEYVISDNVERMAAIMVYGLVGPITVKGQNYASAMAPLGAQLSDEELAAVATYVRSAWSNQAGPVESQVFTDVRAKWGERGPFTIDELGAE